MFSRLGSIGITTHLGAPSPFNHTAHAGSSDGVKAATNGTVIRLSRAEVMSTEKKPTVLEVFASVNRRMDQHRRHFMKAF